MGVFSIVAWVDVFSVVATLSVPLVRMNMINNLVGRHLNIHIAMERMWECLVTLCLTNRIDNGGWRPHK